MAVPNLHAAPKRHSVKIRTFLMKIDSYLEKYEFARRFEVLRLKTPNKFWIDHLKITFKCLNFVCEAFKICSKIRTPPGSEAFEFQNFFVYSKS